jgi:ubiquinone/menaquinone biosynthesis C-methylase UbiE
MELSTAIGLIREGIRSENMRPQVWADLGSGSGLFSRALATLLPPASTIYAVDRDQASLDEIEWSYADRTLIRVYSEISETLELPMLHGALLANVMHFLPDQFGLLKQLQRRLLDKGALIIIEYDTDTGNRWVPYPISYDRMKKLTESLGLGIRLLRTERSRYNSGTLYSVLLHSE